MYGITRYYFQQLLNIFILVIQFYILAYSFHEFVFIVVIASACKVF